MNTASPSNSARAPATRPNDRGPLARGLLGFVANFVYSCTLCCKTLLNFAPGYCRNAYCIYSVPLPCIGRVLAAIDLIAGNLVSSSGQDLCSQGARVRASVKGTQKEKRGGCSAFAARTTLPLHAPTWWRLAGGLGQSWGREWKCGKHKSPTLLAAAREPPSLVSR